MTYTAAARELLGKRLRAHVAAVESARSRLRRAELSRAALGDAVAASERTFGRAREQLERARRRAARRRERGRLGRALAPEDRVHGHRGGRPPEYSKYAPQPRPPPRPRPRPRHNPTTPPA